MTATTHAHHLLNSLPYKTPLTRPSSSPSTGGLFAFPVALRPWLVLQCRGARFRAKRNVIGHMSETQHPPTGQDCTIPITVNIASVPDGRTVTTWTLPDGRIISHDTGWSVYPYRVVVTVGNPSWFPPLVSWGIDVADVMARVEQLRQEQAAGEGE